MELNQKTKFTTVKNEYYSAMLVSLDDALRNWDSFSRLDRLEYAYKSLELVCLIKYSREFNFLFL